MLGLPGHQKIPFQNNLHQRGFPLRLLLWLRINRNTLMPLLWLQKDAVCPLICSYLISRNLKPKGKIINHLDFIFSLTTLLFGCYLHLNKVSQQVPKRWINFREVLILEGDKRSSRKGLELILADSMLKCWMFTLKSTIPWILVMVHKRDWQLHYLWDACM